MTYEIEKDVLTIKSKEGEILELTKNDVLKIFADGIIYEQTKFSKTPSLFDNK
jgi:hypothetical protein